MRLLRMGAAALLVATGACGHDRPDDSQRLRVPLVPTVLPPGYVVSRVDERPGGDHGRWIDFSIVPESNPPNDATDVVSLHQFLDVDASAGLSSDFFAEGRDGRKMTVRGRPGLCGEDRVLRWIESDTALMSVGGGSFTCEALRPVAESLTKVDEDAWRSYVASARDG